jgi:hypothetical protein
MNAGDHSDGRSVRLVGRNCRGGRQEFVVASRLEGLFNMRFVSLFLLLLSILLTGLVEHREF